MKRVNNRFLASLAAISVLLVILFMHAAPPTPRLIADDGRHSSVTGYFGLDEEGLPIVDRKGIMVVFDGDIAAETVSVDTFEVWLDDETLAEVVETRVDGSYVFLRLSDELASDATPVIQIAEGEEVEDLAGNSTNRRKAGAVRIKDGIAPRLTVTLSGGSGRGTGDEGPNRLTNDSIDIQITSDEPLQGAPRVVVVCDALAWTENDGSTTVSRDIDDFMANRRGPHPRAPGEPTGTSYTCGYDVDGDGEDDPFELTEDFGRFRPTENWRSTWQNRQSESTKLHDGKLVVVVYARDRSGYEWFGETVSNWATAKGDFGFDTRFGSEALLEQVKIHPPDGSVIRERRPFVLLEFPETTLVNLASVIFDGEEIVDQFEVVTSNEFVYWPLSMNQGLHSVEVEANDSAGNETGFEFHFGTTQRGDFVLPLVAGWNAVSIPADPIDPEIENVFTHPAIEYVVSWDPYAVSTPWAVSLRTGDSWEPVIDLGPKVSEVVAGQGYWVHTSQFIKQPIKLSQRVTAETGMNDLPCPYNGRWCFVGVIDKNGAQTQDNFGEPLRNHNGVIVTAEEYLASYRSFVWDPIEAEFHSLASNDAVIIGAGIWVWNPDNCLCP